MWRNFVLVYMVIVVHGDNPYCKLHCKVRNVSVEHTVCVRDKEKCGAGPKCGEDFKVIDRVNLKKFVLDLHNQLRNKVASGGEKRGEQPSATNIVVMRYDKELEFIAQCWANTCNGRMLVHDKCRNTRHYKYVGQNIAIIQSSSPNINIKDVIKHMVMMWYDEVESFKNAWVNNTQNRGPKYKIGHYTQMLWAKTEAIGCGLTYYTDIAYGEKMHNFFLVCNYGPGGNYMGRPVYLTGKPCKDCYYGCDDTYHSLCAAP